jgi:hypothetical protein
MIISGDCQSLKNFTALPNEPSYGAAEMLNVIETHMALL